MTMEKFAAVAEIINAAAVTLTLLGLIVTIRQNTKSQKALAVDSLAAAIASINVPATQSPALGSALSQRGERLGVRHARRTHHGALLPVLVLQASRERVVPAEGRNPRCGPVAGMGTGASASIYHSPGVREVWWPNRRHAYSAEFQAYLAGTTPPTEIGSLAEIFDHAPAQSQP